MQEEAEEEENKMGLGLRRLLERVGCWGQETCWSWWFVGGRKESHDECLHSAQSLVREEGPALLVM